jgi:GTP-binding protein
MSRTPVIAIVGRPNVGKSTLFNRFVRRRSAIVHDTPGVTRDRHTATCKLLDQWPAVMVDTGGFAPGETEGMLPLMREQALLAMQEADVILFVTNARDGVTPADEEIAHVLRRSKKPVLLLANKCDAPSIDMEAMSLYSLGFDHVYTVAAEHGRGLAELNEDLLALLAERDLLVTEDDSAPVADEFSLDASLEGEPGVVGGAEADAAPQRGGVVSRLRVCVVGRPNVGKSTLINKLLGKERVIAADQPGTTRDAIDIDFEHEGQPMTLVDTAGLRRKRSISEAIEQYSVSQAVRAIERCHIAILVLDASQQLADQDARIAALVLDRNRACVVCVNKWDAIEKETRTMAAYEHALGQQLPFLDHAPKVFLSAKTGQRVDKLMGAVREAFDAFNCRVPTAAFNKWLIALQQHHQPPTHRGRALKMYYGHQIGVRPPQFLIQVNRLDAMSPAYERFFMAQMRENWGLGGTPLKLQFRPKPPRKPKTRTVAAFEDEPLDEAADALPPGQMVELEWDTDDEV